MLTNRLRLAAALTLSTLVGCATTNSPSAAPLRQDGGWDFAIKPYIWAAGLEGDAKLTGGPGLPVSAEFDDLLDHLDGGLMLGAEFGPADADWTILVDTLYIDLGSDHPSIDVNTEERILEIDYVWSPFGDEGVDWIFGLRQTSLDYGVTAGAVDFNDEQTWVDPIVGMRSRNFVSDTVTIDLRGDIGGMLVGSDFTYQVYASLNWHLSDDLLLGLGYRHLYVDYEDGDFEWDMTTSGPLFGLSWGLGG